MLEQLPSGESLMQKEPPCGCAYLRAIRHQLEWGTFPSTGGEYLDTIFIRREILVSQPAAHQDCALAFRDLAGILHKRPPSPNRAPHSQALPPSTPHTYRPPHLPHHTL